MMPGMETNISQISFRELEWHKLRWIIWRLSDHGGSTHDLMFFMCFLSLSQMRLALPRTLTLVWSYKVLSLVNLHTLYRTWSYEDPSVKCWDVPWSMLLCVMLCIYLLCLLGMHLDFGNSGILKSLLLLREYPSFHKWKQKPSVLLSLQVSTAML